MCYAKRKERKNKNEKTIRILTIYHLFRTCLEVSLIEIKNSIGYNWSNKTIFRDIAILKEAGVPIRYSGRRKAYITHNDNSEKEQGLDRNTRVFIGGVREKQYFDKIKRLIKIMDDMDPEDCDIWYRDTFPDVSERTMKRDFALLKELNEELNEVYDDYTYEVYYKRAWNDPELKDDENPPGHYYLKTIWDM